jgi:hypothetical protein
VLHLRFNRKIPCALGTLMIAAAPVLGLCFGFAATND